MKDCNANSNQNSQQLENEVQQLLLVSYLINGVYKENGRRRISPSHSKILLQIFQFSKKVHYGEWEEVFPSKESIAQGAGVSRTQVTEFINSSDFEMFCEVERRDRAPGSCRYQTNIYRLKPWVIKILLFFERVGMMKNFRTNFCKWLKTFNKRFNKWLLPLIEKGLSLFEVMNKLSTKHRAKPAAEKGLKPAGIKSSKEEEIKLTGYRSNTEYPNVPVITEFFEIGRILKHRFLLKEGDINQLLSCFSPRTHKEAIRIGLKWLQNGLESRFPICVYQSCLNRAKALFLSKKKKYALAV